MKTTIAIVTCYHDPDYIRARTLRSAVAGVPGVRIIIIKNTHKNILRYFDVLREMARIKRQMKPQAFLITFRGQEILPFALLIAGKTPVWFDEFIVPAAYMRLEKHRRTLKKRIASILFHIGEPFYRACLRRCQFIFSDTPSHAELSAKMSEINLRKYIPIPVGADETVFKPKHHVKKTEPFRVFYYSTDMQPLHGIAYVLDAAERLAGDRRFEFILVGGKKSMEQAVATAVERGARITYHSWIPFNEIPILMRESGIVLGGPFGGTPQAAHVVTGKTYQALACGAPTIIGANQDTESLFVDRENTLIIRQQSPEALMDALVWAVEHPLEIARIAEKGRALYERTFSNEALSRIMTPLIERIRPE